MKKNYWSKITWLILGIVPLLLIACGGSAVEPTATVPAPATEELAAPTAVPVLEEAEDETEAVEVEEMEAETAVSDEVVPVAAKPQLIEFYADW